MFDEGTFWQKHISGGSRGHRWHTSPPNGTQFFHFHIVLYTSGPVSLKERLLYTLNKLFVKQVKSFYLLLDPNPFIFLCLLHNTKYIKFTSIQDISIKVSGGSTYKSFQCAPPNRTKFFCLYICFHQKVPVSEVGTPSNEGWHPPNGKSWIRP